jgi:drug/metabolite transporter (DMT)-like permease
MGCLILASGLWAFSFGLIKTFPSGVDPSFVACVRLALSFLVFAWAGRAVRTTAGA